MQDQFFDLNCKTDEYKPNQSNGFTSPILKNLDMSKINSKYSSTLYGNFKIDKINAADKIIKSTPQLDLNLTSFDKMFTASNSNTFVSNNRFLSEENSKNNINNRLMIDEEEIVDQFNSSLSKDFLDLFAE